MKSRQAMRALAGILLCGLGLWLALPTPYRERTFLIDAGGCRLVATIVERQEGGSQGSVLLFHGISANKKIMSYLARGFAEQGLRVYVPDLPGHGRTPGPFSAARAEQCAEALLHELLVRGMIDANRTILAGHSMGGAIAERLAARVPVAGLIAISPAPMRAAHGVTAEKLFFSDPPELPPHSLVIVGSLELESMRGNAADLVGSRGEDTARFLEIPAASHVSILFSGAAMRASQEWSARVLHLPSAAALPSRRALFGALAGFAGSGWKGHQQGNRHDGCCPRHAAAFSRIYNRIAADRADLANRDSGEGFPDFSGRLSCQLRASLWAFAACATWEPRAFRALELPSSHAGGGICRNRAATARHGVV
jgi:pimeloyl-ACP methyl ester carboxylesterase